MFTTDGLTCSTAPVTAREYASRKAESSVTEGAPDVAGDSDESAREDRKSILLSTFMPLLMSKPRLRIQGAWSMFPTLLVPRCIGYSDILVKRIEPLCSVPFPR